MSRLRSIPPSRVLIGALVLGAAFGAGGCGRKAGAPPAAPSASSGAPGGKKTGESMNVGLTAGQADRRDLEKNVRLYTVRWKTSALTLDRQGIQEGRMNGVDGTVYEDERPKSTFTADTGYARKMTQTLYLEGRVVVKSPTYRATLRAKKLEWLPDVKRYKATGDVTLTTPTGSSGPMPELLATSDLRRFGTPDLFDKR